MLYEQRFNFVSGQCVVTVEKEEEAVLLYMDNTGNDALMPFMSLGIASVSVMESI